MPYSNQLFENEESRKIIARAQPKIQEFVIRNLAGVFSRCIECKKNPREETDWLTAESLITDSPAYITGLASRVLAFKAEMIDCIENNRPFIISSDVLEGFAKGELELAQIVEHLKSLDSDRRNYLLDRAANECSWDNDFTDKVLGREIFSLYQSVRTGLPKEKYGRILFW